MARKVSVLIKDILDYDFIDEMEDNELLGFLYVADLRIPVECSVPFQQRLVEIEHRNNQTNFIQ